MAFDRQHAAIIFADISGYTTLMQEDESNAVRVVRAYKSVIHEVCAAWEGQVAQFYGDGCLMTFAEPEAAVRCAMALQAQFLSLNIPVRIGINLGEIVAEEEHIYGDAINVASRIESMGLPGTVLLSQSVYESVAEKPGIDCQSLGVFALRHVEQPMEIYALVTEGLFAPTREQMMRKGTAYEIDNSPAAAEGATTQIQILVVEDDMIVGAHISMVLAEAGYGVLGLIPTGEAALEQIRTFPPDLVLMDVNLKGKLDGIETASRIFNDSKVPVIFLTANSDSATFERAKAAFPYAFINKPFKPVALLRAIELVVQRIQEEKESPAAPQPAAALQPPQSDHIFVRDKDRMVKVRLADIQYVEAERNYCRIHTLQRQFLLSTPMKTVENSLGTVSFVRTHRSFVVNLGAIEGLDEHYLYLKEQAIPLSKAYKDDVMQRLNRI